MGMILGFIVVCGIGIGSSYFLGSDNPLEEKMEEIAEEMILVEIRAPDGEVSYGWLDFSPATPEKKRGYIEND